MKSRSIVELMNKKGIAMITAFTIALTSLGVANVTAYADEIESVQEVVEESTKDFNNGVYFQNQLGYSIKSVSTDDTAVKVYAYDLSKKLSDQSTVCLKGNTLAKYDTKGNLLWEKELESQVCYSTPTYNNLLVDSKDNIIVLGYYSGVTNGIYAVYDVNGNRTDYKYGTYVPVPVYRDSVTLDMNENLIYQKAHNTSVKSPEQSKQVNTYYVYDRNLYNYTSGELIETNYYFHYRNSNIVTTTDGGRIIIGSTQLTDSSCEDYAHYTELIKVNSNNKVVFCTVNSNMKASYERKYDGVYPTVYKTADGGLIVRNKADGFYYKIDTATGGASLIKTYGTVLGFKSVNGVDYMYGKMGKSTLGDMASNIVTSTVDYVIPVGKDLTNGVYFNSNFGRIKDLDSDVDGNIEVLFSCSSNEILNSSDFEAGTSKIISVTLTK